MVRPHDTQPGGDVEDAVEPDRLGRGCFRGQVERPDKTERIDVVLNDRRQRRKVLLAERPPVPGPIGAAAGIGQPVVR